MVWPHFTVLRRTGAPWLVTSCSSFGFFLSSVLCHLYSVFSIPHSLIPNPDSPTHRFTHACLVIIFLQINKEQPGNQVKHFVRTDAEADPDDSGLKFKAGFKRCDIRAGF